MKTGNENIAGNGTPPMRLPKQEDAKFSFEEMCQDLGECITKCYEFFMWYGGNDKCLRDEIRSTIFLECLFLWMLSDISYIMQKRGRLLLDESVSLFTKLLKMLNDKMRTGHLFITSSSNTLQDETNGETECFAASRLDVVEAFREHGKWLCKLTADAGNRSRAKLLANRLQLNYPMKMFGCMGDEFAQHANMVLNGLMLLAIPSLANGEDKDFVQVFQDSIDTFRKGSAWQTLAAQLEEKLEHDLKNKNCESYAAKMARVKEVWWKPKREAIEAYLSGFGITYVNVLSPAYMGQLGRQLYERLNGIRIDAKDDSPLVKMTNDDLCQYLRMESELQYFASKIEKYRVLKDDPLPPDDYFEPEAQRVKIRQAIYNTIYEKGDNKREVLYAQSHWFAIHKVLEHHGMCIGTLKDFQTVMAKWFATAPHPCDYDSLKNMKVATVRSDNYLRWSPGEHAVIPYRRVALTLAKHLREEGLID